MHKCSHLEAVACILTYRLKRPFGTRALTMACAKTGTSCLEHCQTPAQLAAGWLQPHAIAYAVFGVSTRIISVLLHHPTSVAVLTQLTVLDLPSGRTSARISLPHPSTSLTLSEDHRYLVAFRYQSYSLLLN